MPVNIELPDASRQAVSEILTGVMEDHEKMAWLLRSMLSISAGPAVPGWAKVVKKKKVTPDLFGGRGERFAGS